MRWQLHSRRATNLPDCPSAFDPKPFIRSLEAAVDRLIAVRKDVQARTEQMERSVKVAEREYSKKMVDLNKGFEVCLQKIIRNVATITRI